MRIIFLFDDTRIRTSEGHQDYKRTVYVLDHNMSQQQWGIYQYYFLQIYKGSAWAPAFAGAHESGRAGQHFDNLRCSCPIWHANFKVMPRV